LSDVTAARPEAATCLSVRDPVAPAIVNEGASSINLQADQDIPWSRAVRLPVTGG
jgi:hypothetical protein